MSRKKQHHYVTKAYLNGFLVPPEQQLSCYGRGRSGCFRKSPDELGTQRNYYSLRNQDGTWDDTQEDLIGRTIEDPGLPVIKKLSRGQNRLSWEERRALAFLIAFQEMRTPEARAQARAHLLAMSSRILSTAKKTHPEQRSIEMIGKDGAVSEVSLDEIVASDADLVDDHSHRIHSLLGLQAIDMAKIYARMKFTVYYSPRDMFFITTDNPVVRVFYSNLPKGAGVNRSDIEIRFPLARNAFLTLIHDKTMMREWTHSNERRRRRLLERLPEVSVKTITASEVDALNRGHARHARRWVFSPKEISYLNKILMGRALTPTLTDLSRPDMFHFRVQPQYDPMMDL